MTDKPTVIEAISAVMEEVQSVAKRDRHNSSGANFMFRGIDAVMNAVGPALRKHRVVVMPQLQSVEHRDVQTSGGKASRETTVMVKYVWIGPDGSTLETIVPGEAMDNGDKGTAKAMSVAFRIALLQCLCLPTDDPEPDAQAYERESHPPRRPAPQRPREVPASGAPEPEPEEVPEWLLAQDAIVDWCRGQRPPVETSTVARAFHMIYGAEIRDERSVPRLVAVLRILQKQGLDGLLPKAKEPVMGDASTGPDDMSNRAE